MITKHYRTSQRLSAVRLTKSKKGFQRASTHQGFQRMSRLDDLLKHCAGLTVTTLPVFSLRFQI